MDIRGFFGGMGAAPKRSYARVTADKDSTNTVTATPNSESTVSSPLNKKSRSGPLADVTNKAAGKTALSDAQKEQIEMKKKAALAKMQHKLASGEGVVCDKVLKTLPIESLDASWKAVIGKEFEKPYFAKLTQFLEREWSQHKVFPPAPMIFNALNWCKFDEVKVVILGQDPYHDVNQAHGLCFSVQKGVRVPPSLVNIYKELNTDIHGFKIPKHGNLEHWARQGVLLLNTSLTVRAHQAGSHSQEGWSNFTSAIIQAVAKQKTGAVFMLWGKHAEKAAGPVSSQAHCILKSVHPSPLSAHRGFLGCKHFSKANAYLQSKGKTPIDWQIPE